MNNTVHHTTTLHRPVAFPGTLAEADENSLTHLFTWADEDVRCMNCDCRPSHVAASYPCGTEPARETVTSYFNEDGEFLGQTVEPYSAGWKMVSSDSLPLPGEDCPF